MKKFGTFFVIIIVVLTSNVLQAQWQPDVRLTIDAANSAIYGARNISATGNYVHVIWVDSRNGPNNSEIYYKRSTDQGLSWGQDIRISNDTNFSQSPEVFASGSVVHIVWQDSREGNPQVYYKRSSDGGVSWGSETRLTIEPAGSWIPSISASGSIVHIIWENSYWGDIFYKRSTDSGISWGPDTRVTFRPKYKLDNKVSVSGSDVHIVWAELLTSWPYIYHIYYKRSSDAGLSWGSDIRLTSLNDSTIQGHPSISVSDQVVHIVWEKNGGIYYRRSIDGGISWETETQPTNSTTCFGPSIIASGSIVHIVCGDTRIGNTKIYYMRSTNNGISWEADTQLTNNFYPADRPSISASGQVVHVIWEDTRDLNSEIYYKRNPTDNVIGILNIISEIPKKYSLSQNYPNPFNPSTKISWQSPVSNHQTLKVYDVLGREVAILFNEEKSAGTYKVTFDGSDLASGIYYYQLRAGSFSESKKMILIK